MAGLDVGVCRNPRRALQQILLDLFGFTTECLHLAIAKIINVKQNGNSGKLDNTSICILICLWSMYALVLSGIPLPATGWSQNIS